MLKVCSPYSLLDTVKLYFLSSALTIFINFMFMLNISDLRKSLYPRACIAISVYCLETDQQMTNGNYKSTYILCMCGHVCKHACLEVEGMGSKTLGGYFSPTQTDVGFALIVVK